MPCGSEITIRQPQLPQALERFAKATRREEHRGLAIQQLQELRKGDSEEVREEALYVLAKLGVRPNEI
jgi:hypothetical protein